jgi:hypothetical protein
MLSERVLFALNDVDDMWLEAVGSQLGYRKSKVSRRKNIGRVLILAAVIAAFLAFGAVAYAMSSGWSSLMLQQLKATQTQQQDLAEQGLATVFDSDDMAVTANGVTVRPIETVIDKDFVHITFEVIGYELNDGEEPSFQSISIDAGDTHLSWGGSFNCIVDESGKEVYENENGNLEYVISGQCSMANDNLLGKQIQMSFQDLGQNSGFGKDGMHDIVSGEWSFTFNAPDEIGTRYIMLDMAIDGTVFAIDTVEISYTGIELYYTVNGPVTIVDDDMGMPMFYGLVLNDGTRLERIGIGGKNGYTDYNLLSNAFQVSGFNQVIEPENVSAIILELGEYSGDYVEIPLK